MGSTDSIVQPRRQAEGFEQGAHHPAAGDAAFSSGRLGVYPNHSPSTGMNVQSSHAKTVSVT
jgi:hypothetical protein